MSEVKEQWKEQGVIVPAAKSSALAVNGSSPIGAYLAQHGVGTGGVFIKFAKDGVYRKQADDAQIPTGTEVAVVYDEIRVGWIKFLEKGQQPERKMGPVFSGFVPPVGKRTTSFPKDQRELCLATAWRLVEDGQTVLIFCPLRASVEPFATAIVDEQNITRAAQNLHISQPALSRTLAVIGPQVSIVISSRPMPV